MTKKEKLGRKKSNHHQSRTIKRYHVVGDRSIGYEPRFIDAYSEGDARDRYEEMIDKENIPITVDSRNIMAELK